MESWIIERLKIEVLSNGNGKRGFEENRKMYSKIEWKGNGGRTKDRYHNTYLREVMWQHCQNLETKLNKYEVIINWVRRMTKSENWSGLKLVLHEVNGQPLESTGIAKGLKSSNLCWVAHWDYAFTLVNLCRAACWASRLSVEPH